MPLNQFEYGIFAGKSHGMVVRLNHLTANMTFCMNHLNWTVNDSTADQPGATLPLSS
jgi:hypothetical protein